MFKSIWVMASFSFKEMTRKKVMLAAIVLTVLFLVIYGLGVHFIRGSGDQGPQFKQMAPIIAFQLLSMGLYLAMLLTGLLAAFAGVGAVSGEIESGTAYALLVKPVSRAQLLVGKFVGYGVMLAIYSALFFLAIWGLVTWQWRIALPGAWVVLPLFALQPLVLLAVAFLGSTRLSTLANGIVLFLLYGLSLVGGMLEQIGALLGPAAGSQAAGSLVKVGIVSSLILPVDAIYRRAIYLLTSRSHLTFGIFNNLGPFGSASAPSNAMVIYALCYLLVCLWLAGRAFNSRDI